jgi:hypothetical protein
MEFKYNIYDIDKDIDGVDLREDLKGARIEASTFDGLHWFEYAWFPYEDVWILPGQTQPVVDRYGVFRVKYRGPYQLAIIPDYYISS